ncbi:MAG: hypothetical protein FJY29_11575 [Betaproteobacteria bacterium]|nr:hypothetical protein [Betaproteobacteria bacterium]
MFSNCRSRAPFCLLLTALGFAFPRHVPAQVLGGSQSRDDATGAAVSLLEFNPADLVWGRYRFAHENLILDSLSFSLVGEVQDSLRQSQFEEKNIAAGLSLQYYPQSISLNGLFLRAESDLALSKVEEDASARRSAQSASVAHVRLAGDLGWRVRLSDRLTGSAAYGLRTTLSQALWSSDSATAQRWLNQKSADVAPRVQINLGVLL